MFEERVEPTKTSGSVLVEHFIRYRFVVAQVGCTDCAYFDVGCGNGFGLRVLLSSTSNIVYGIDIEQSALGNTREYLGESSQVQLHGLDLNLPSAYTSLMSLVQKHEHQRRVIVCFETLEHLDDFQHLIKFLNYEVGMGADVFLSVPNDAFWGMQNPYHRSVFGKDALQELIQLFDTPPRLYHQYSLVGAAVIPASLEHIDEKKAVGEFFSGAPERQTIPSIPSHFILCFGPAAGGECQFQASFVLEDNATRRQWEAQRESDLAYWRDEAKRRGAK